jgi:hypothetical protein
VEDATMTDTSTKAVERLAAFHEGEGQYLEVAEGVGDEMSITYGETARITAATLRALMAERDAALARMERLTVECEQDMMRAEAERDAARAECERLRLGGCARGQITTQWCAEAVEMMAQRDAARRAARAFEAETAKAHENSKRWRSERDTWQRIAMDAAQRLMLAETERDTASTSDDGDAITAEDEDRAFLGFSDEDDDE